MGVDTAPAIAAALIEHGRERTTPVAVVTDGSTPTQRVVRTTLDGLAKAMAEEGIRPPAVWVVGDVVGLGAGEQHSPEGPADDAEDED
jgi:uroporphyrin-III C-methyltransferase/precorrin-2 dehydrogenase/sirohydrochlorin ferrochelatase